MKGTHIVWVFFIGCFGGTPVAAIRKASFYFRKFRPLSLDNFHFL